MNLGPRTRGVTVGLGASSLGDVCYPLYRRVFDEEGAFVAAIERKLVQSRTNETVEHYLSRALGVGLLLGALLWLVGVVVGYVLVSTGRVQLLGALLGVSVGSSTLLATLRVPAVVLSTGVAFGTIGFAAGFGSLLVIPYSRASARKREIDLLLPDSISFLYALSVGGLNQLELIEALADAEETYGDVSREFQSIVNETEFLGVDYRTAIRNRAQATPSAELSQFLTDLLSIINSGGDVERFLEDQTDAHMRSAKQRQERTLETLELFGELYIALSLFPLLLLIVLVIMQLVPDAGVSTSILYLTVYGLLPLIGLGFLVLVSTVSDDEPGNGYLRTSEERQAESSQTQNALSLGLVERFTGEYTVFDRIKDREGTYETGRMLSRPHLFFRDHPQYTLALTIPAALVMIATAGLVGSAPTSVHEFSGNPVWGTFVYVYLPLYIISLPLAIFYEWNGRHRNAAIANLSGTLRKLSSANETGLTLLESLETVAETSHGTLAREFEVIRTKVTYGMRIEEALVEFNNAYRIPRLARTTRLLGAAQQASNQLSAVLRTAARASEAHDDLERDRRSRTQMQVAIVVMTFVTMVAVLVILETQFVETMTGLDAGDGTETADSDGTGAALSGGADASVLSMLFFHAITIQAILAGLVCGSIRDGSLRSGLKYVVVLSTIALGSWVIVV